MKCKSVGLRRACKAVDRFKYFASTKACVISALLLSLSQPVFSLDFKAISVNIRPKTSANALKINRAIAELAVPVEASTKAGETAEQFLERQCGMSTKPQLDSLLSLNPDIQEKGPVPAKIYFYPCVFFKKQQTVAIPFNGSVALTSSLNLGTFGDQTSASIARLNPQLPDLSKVGFNDKIVLPYVNSPTSFIKRDATSITVDDLAQIARGIDPNGSVDEGPPGQLVVAEKIDMSPEETAICRPIDDNWPIRERDINDLLVRYVSDSLSSGPYGPIRLTLTGVVDTGVTRSALSWLPIYKSPRESESLPAKDRDSNRYLNDVFGADLPRNGFFPQSNSAYPFSDHGTQVSSIASGISLLKAEELTAKLVGLKELGIVQQLRSGPGSPTWSIDSSSLSRSAYYRVSDPSLGRTQPRVLNWSWQRVGDDPLVADVLQSPEVKDRVLIVVAAGNTSTDLDAANPPIFPADISADDSSAAVITVAAIRPDRQLASFSNRGHNFVTVAAPGCGIPAFGDGQVPLLLDGTSMASPIVAFTAAVLFSLNIDDPWEVKQRIIYSSDVEEGLLAAKSVSEGHVLNILAALAVRDDVIKLKTGETLVGSIKVPVSLVFDNSQLVDLEKIRRIHFGAESSDGKVVLKYQYSSKSIKDVNATLANDVLVFTRVGGFVEEQFHISEVSDILPRLLSIPTK